MLDKDDRQEALRQLLWKAKAKGYLLMDNILEVAGEQDLSLPELDRLVSDLTVRNIEILEEAPVPKPEVSMDPNEEKTSTTQKDMGFRDHARLDYNELYLAVAYQWPSMEPLVQELSGVRPPQKGETARLLIQSAEGNAYARNRIIEMYLRLALRCAYLYAQEFELDLEETFGEAVIGLVRAVDSYRLDEQTNFAAYANVAIRHYLQRVQPGVRRLLYYPAHAKTLLYSVYKTLQKKGCTECERRETCLKMKAIVEQCSPTSETWLVEAFYRDVSLDEILENSLGSDLEYDVGNQTECVGDILPDYLSSEPTDVVFENLQKENVRSVISCLRPKEQDVLCSRFGIDRPTRTLEEIGSLMGVTRERVRQIEKRGLEKFRRIWVRQNPWEIQKESQKSSAPLDSSEI